MQFKIGSYYFNPAETVKIISAMQHLDVKGNAFKSYLLSPKVEIKDREIILYSKGERVIDTKLDELMAKFLKEEI